MTIDMGWADLRNTVFLSDEYLFCPIFFGAMPVYCLKHLNAKSHKEVMR